MSGGRDASGKNRELCRSGAATLGKVECRLASTLSVTQSIYGARAFLVRKQRRARLRSTLKSAGEQCGKAPRTAGSLIPERANSEHGCAGCPTRTVSFRLTRQSSAAFATHFRIASRAEAPNASHLAQPAGCPVRLKQGHLRRRCRCVRTPPHLFDPIAARSETESPGPS